MPIDYTSIKLERNSPVRLYHQLADKLQVLLSKSSRRGAIQLPSERELSKQLGIDRSTVSKAYLELERQRVIERRSAQVYVTTTVCCRGRYPFPNIGVVIPCRFSSFVGERDRYQRLYLDGIIDRAAERSYSTLMLQLPPPGASVAEQNGLLDEIGSRLAGIIHLGARSYRYDPPLERLMASTRIPQVMISAKPCGHSHISTVSVACEDVARELALEIRELGHRRVGLVLYHGFLGDASSSPYVRYDVVDRALVFKRAFEEAGLECLASDQLFNATSFLQVFAGIGDCIRRGVPDVFWCESDQIASWVTMSLEKRGLSVPGDVSVVGFDGCPPWGWEERLTTVKLPFYDLGAASVDLLLEQGNQAATEVVCRHLPLAMIRHSSLGRKVK